jgi:hypothetical protein
MGKGRYKVMPIFTFEGQNHTAGFGIIQKTPRALCSKGGGCTNNRHTEYAHHCDPLTFAHHISGRYSQK